MRFGMVAAAAVAMVVSAPAVGQTVSYAIYEGTISANSFDRGGLFGSVGASLANTPFTAVYRIDEGATYTTSFSGDPANAFGLSRESGSGTTPSQIPFVSAYLLVNGRRVRVGPYYSIETVERRDNGLEQIEHFAIYGRTDGNVTEGRELDAIICDADGGQLSGPLLRTGLTFRSSNPFCGGGYFLAYSVNTVTGSGTVTSFGLMADTLRVTSFVPEPATWSLMILGFGAVGFAMRRRPAYAPAKYA